jgi:hypothetical protein
MVISVLGLKMGIVEAGVPFFHPGGADEVGINLGRRRSQGLGGNPFSPIRLDDVTQVFMAQGIVM